MSYADIRAQADSTPLEIALNTIAKLVTASESDPELMLEMLDKIDDAITEGRTAYMANIRSAQEKELEMLRALARSDNQAAKP